MADLTPTRISGGLSASEKRSQRGRALYNMINCDSGKWKETYRQRCAKRLKANRNNCMDRCRREAELANDDIIVDTVHSIMQEEWDNIKSEIPLPPLSINGHKRSGSFFDSPSQSSKRPNLEEMMCTPERSTSCRGYWSTPQSTIDIYEDIDDILKVMDDITEELIKEEQQIIAHYEETQRFTENAITAAIDSLCTDDIICPLCLKNILRQNNELIYCPCGLSINTAQDGLTLDYVREQLDDATTQHSHSCHFSPSFSLQSVVSGMTNLVMSCECCDMLYIIV